MVIKYSQKNLRVDFLTFRLIATCDSKVSNELNKHLSANQV